ncbi:hypothetical protein K4K57_007573 [Colletotrichum sp. SAR 10_99]|nr:hypothetical protein K4K57_007573 [Colletotrichum sp. SAR 10_99]
MHNQLNNSILSPTQDNYPYHPIDIEISREASIKCLGTYKTMASPTSTSPAPAPAPPTAVSPRPLHPNVYRPITPPSPTGAAPSKPAANFVLRTVAILRALALIFAIVLLVLEFEGRRHYSFATFFIVVAFFQLFWLAFSLLAEILPAQHHGRRKGVTLDFGVVKCIFGRSGYPDDSDDEEAGMLLMGFAGDVPRKWNRRDLLFSVVDLALGSTTFGIAVTNVNGNGRWYAWETFHTIGAIALVVASFEFVIAVAQQITLLKRARIRISHDEEGDEDAGSHKYRIRLPESPERGRPAMSVAAHTAI